MSRVGSAQALMKIDRGFDCLDEAFQADFTTIVDVFRAVLFRDFNLYHPLQEGLSNKIDKWVYIMPTLVDYTEKYWI